METTLNPEHEEGNSSDSYLIGTKNLDLIFIIATLTTLAERVAREH